MTITTVAVRVLVSDPDGPLANAKITASLSHQDVDPAGGFVLPEPVEGSADEDGVAILNLWPNELGSTSSFYNFKIAAADDSATLIIKATIPNSDCDLHLVANLPPYPGKTDGQLALEAAIASVNAALSEFKTAPIDGGIF